MKTIYFDQDGVLAKWRTVPVWVTHFPLYFLFLRKDQAAVDLLHSLRGAGYNVGVLTKAYNRMAAFEKKLWIRLVIGKVPVIIVPYMESKLSYVGAGDAILIDDYSHNLREWASSGRTSVKYRNRVNGTHGTWRGASITWNMRLEEAMSIVTAAAS